MQESEEFLTDLDINLGKARTPHQQNLVVFLALIEVFLDIRDVLLLATGMASADAPERVDDTSSDNESKSDE